MPKFSDPNYQLLERYFDILVNRTTGTQRSFLAGPRQSIWADGGVFTILYEDDPTYGFVGKKFLIQEIDGNRFKMEYQGVYEDWKKYRTDTETESLSAIGIGNEMYFRKDSFFHEWLSRSENLEFRNYVNQEKTFAFFGKVWPVGQSKTIFSIEFEGLKDYTVKALPYHNQTTNLVEWLKVYFDQVHHEPYTMLKTAWSLMDAREIQLRWLGYIAQIYGIEINEQLAELNLREWVENLIYFLKRIGSYDALYVIWLLFLSNSNNVMNVYERWDELCDGGIASYDRFAGFHPGIPKGVRSYYGPDLKPINDYNWLEFYGQQPSGGAGTLWYSQFDPALYPVHATEKPECFDSWDCGISEEFPCYEARELNSFVSYIRTDTVGISAYDTVDTGTRTLTLPDQNFVGNFQHCAEISMSNQTTENCSFMFYGLSNDVYGFGTTLSDWIAVAIEKVGTQRRFAVYEQVNDIVYSTIGAVTDFEASKRYKVGIERTCPSAGSPILEVYIYDGRREEPNLKEVISHTLQSCQSYTVLHAMNSKTDGLDGDFYGTIYPQHVDFSRFVESLGPTGYPVLTPHYIVEVDLNTEPLIDVQPFNDLFQGQSFIINEFLADELIRNWEYVRPINKHVIYHELISPSASEAKGVTSIPLYPLDSNGFFDTFFTGSQYLSGSGPTPSAGVATYLYRQDYANKEWKIDHGLGRYVVFQAWESLLDCETGVDPIIAKRIEPKNVIIESDDSLTVRFAQPVKGWATIAGSSPYLSYLHKECGCPDGTWTVFHDFEDTPSGGLVGYPSGVGPLVNLWLHSSSSSSYSLSSSSSSRSSSFSISSSISSYSSSSSVSSSISSSSTSSSSTSTAGYIELLGVGWTVDQVSLTDPVTSTFTPPSGTNRCVVVYIGTERSTGPTDINTVTLGGRTLTPVMWTIVPVFPDVDTTTDRITIQDRAFNTYEMVSVWYLLESEIQLMVGNDLSVSWVVGPERGTTIAYVCYENVDQIAPILDNNYDSNVDVANISTNSFNASAGDQPIIFGHHGTSSLIGFTGSTEFSYGDLGGLDYGFIRQYSSNNPYSDLLLTKTYPQTGSGPYDETFTCFQSGGFIAGGFTLKLVGS